MSFVPNVSSFSGFPFLVVPHVFFSNVYFVLCFLYLMVPISLDCPFLIVPSIFFKVYFFLGVVYTILLVSLDWIVHSWFFLWILHSSFPLRLLLRLSLTINIKLGKTRSIMKYKMVSIYSFEERSILHSNLDKRTYNIQSF